MGELVVVVVEPSLFVTVCGEPGGGKPLPISGLAGLVVVCCAGAGALTINKKPAKMSGVKARGLEPVAWFGCIASACANHSKSVKRKRLRFEHSENINYEYKYSS